MVCEANETDLDIQIPAVMLPQDAGANLENHIKNNSLGMLPLILYFSLLSCNLLLIDSFRIIPGLLSIIFIKCVLTVCMFQCLCSCTPQTVQWLMLQKCSYGLWLLVLFYVHLTGPLGLPEKQLLNRTSC